MKSPAIPRPRILIQKLTSLPDNAVKKEITDEISPLGQDLYNRGMACTILANNLADIEMNEEALKFRLEGIEFLQAYLDLNADSLEFRENFMMSRLSDLEILGRRLHSK